MTDDEIPGGYDTSDGIQRRAEHFGNPIVETLVRNAKDRVSKKPHGLGYEIAPPEGDAADDSLAMVFHFGVLTGAALEREYPGDVTGSEGDR